MDEGRPRAFGPGKAWRGAEAIPSITLFPYGGALDSEAVAYGAPA